MGGQVFLVSLGVFCNVPVVVSLHLVEEHFDGITGRVGDEIVIEQLEDSFANAGQFLFNLPLVVLYFLHVVLVTYNT